MNSPLGDINVCSIARNQIRIRQSAARSSHLHFSTSELHCPGWPNRMRDTRTTILNHNWIWINATPRHNDSTQHKIYFHDLCVSALTFRDTLLMLLDNHMRMKHSRAHETHRRRDHAFTFWLYCAMQMRESAAEIQCIPCVSLICRRLCIETEFILTFNIYSYMRVNMCVCWMVVCVCVRAQAALSPKMNGAQIKSLRTRRRLISL